METNRTTRLLYIGLGWLFFSVGLVGAVLPVLPTTPFMILALGAFAKGSRRLHGWLYAHPRYGPALHLWNEHHVIPLRAKIIALVAMSASLFGLLVTSAVSPLVMYAASCIVAFGALYILSKPSQAPGE